MDIRRDGFFGYLSINGRQLEAHRGSIMGIVGESLKALAAERSRLNADGELEIVLRVRNKPADHKTDQLVLGVAEEVSALLDSGENDTPRHDESYEEFYARLLKSDYPQASAEYIAGQWFDRPVSPETTLWLNDPKAVRFRVLNSRDEEFEAALPSEYESLKNYVKTTYPQFIDGLTFRTA